MTSIFPNGSMPQIAGYVATPMVFCCFVDIDGHRLLGLEKGYFLANDSIARAMINYLITCIMINYLRKIGGISHRVFYRGKSVAMHD